MKKVILELNNRFVVEVEDDYNLEDDEYHDIIFNIFEEQLSIGNNFPENLFWEGLDVVGYEEDENKKI